MRAAQNAQNNHYLEIALSDPPLELFSCRKTAEFNIQGDELRAFRNHCPQGEMCADEGRG